MRFSEFSLCFLYFLGEHRKYREIQRKTKKTHTHTHTHRLLRKTAKFPTFQRRPRGLCFLCFFCVCYVFLCFLYGFCVFLLSFISPYQLPVQKTKTTQKNTQKTTDKAQNKHRKTQKHHRNNTNKQQKTQKYPTGFRENTEPIPENNAKKKKKHTHTQKKCCKDFQRLHANYGHTFRV